MSLYTEMSAAHGLEYDEFANLPRATRKKLVRLMARISERSYRRGLQQGVYLHKHNALLVDPRDWRYKIDLDLSPAAEFGEAPLRHEFHRLGSGSICRLYAEERYLDEIGLGGFDE